MEIIQLTPEEYEDKQPLEDGDFIDTIEKKYPKLYPKILQEIQRISDIISEIDGYKSRKYTENELKMIYSSDEFAEAFDDEYLNEYGDSILINYVVYDEIGTDRGIWHTVLASGYELTEEVK